MKCACGCGQEVKLTKKDGSPRYCNGHKQHPGKKFMQDAICACCGKSIQVDHFRLEASERVFCNRKCQGRFKSEQAKREFVCLYCNKTFHKPGRNQKEHKFCSQKCMGAYKTATQRKSTATVRCSYCGKSIEVWNYKAKQNKHFYCNVICRANHILGKNNPAYTNGKGRRVQYGKNWNSQRNKAIKRDNYTCQSCGKKQKEPRDLHVHHIVPAHTFNGDYKRANHLSNLITLCVTCHELAERGATPIQPKFI